MICCNKCKSEVNIDNCAFEGKFFDYHGLENLHICDECMPQLAKLFLEFLDKDLNKELDINKQQEI